MSLMSKAFRRLVSSFLSVVVDVDVLSTGGFTSAGSDAEPSSWSCFSTEIAATGLSVGVPGPSSDRFCSVFNVGVHLKLVDVDDVTGVAAAVLSGNVADLDVPTSLKGVASDSNFCARIFTGKRQTAPARNIVQTSLSRRRSSPRINLPSVTN